MSANFLTAGSLGGEVLLSLEATSGFSLEVTAGVAVGGCLGGEVVLSFEAGGSFGFEVTAGVVVSGCLCGELVLKGQQLVSTDQVFHASQAEALAGVASFLGGHAIGVMNKCRQVGQSVSGDADARLGGGVIRPRDNRGEEIEIGVGRLGLVRGGQRGGFGLIAGGG